MAKHYRYVNGKKLIVVNNYDLGTDVIPDEGEPIVPDPTVADAGKILQVNNAGNLAYVDPPEELPTLTGNAGKVLKVASGASGVEWADETSDLPAVTIDDAGDVLTVNASGEWAKAAPSGGGSPLLVNITTQDDVVYTMDKTYSEILTAYQSSGVIFKVTMDGDYTMTGVMMIGAYVSDQEYGITIRDIVTYSEPQVYFSCSSENGYPAYSSGSQG